MPRFGPISRQDLIRCLRQLGFQGPISGGKHQFVVKDKRRVRIPNPHGSAIGKNLLRVILKEAGVSVTEWEDLE
jgi:predicted RNA binding protein YcfA (HicA-like mRNA interferase family)